ncbi:hypothetical protein COCCU_00425 [Corynebacterium occultum]|uniref:DoxX n=1 Tax=Corynebacterium occultum TaxID=2675219 RepID=A0A6B8VPP4_9CORY|nr:hypothetical protein [Corynebacterium occultum]QGU06053.1 hypothetical protein COCCU_00425 [Corynebacterium occultum]
MNISNAILRGVSGAYILQSGVGKLGMPTEAAAGVQEFAATGVPAVKKMSPDTFSKFLSYSEVGIGAALLAPFVSNRIAGAAMGTFSAGLLAIYFRNEAMTQKDGIRPSEAGTGLSKDLFMAAISAALIASKPEKKSN